MRVQNDIVVYTGGLGIVDALSMIGDSKVLSVGFIRTLIEKAELVKPLEQ